ncbi:hypothetical protein [Azospirillum palustre]
MQGDLYLGCGCGTGRPLRKGAVGVGAWPDAHRRGISGRYSLPKTTRWSDERSRLRRGHPKVCAARTGAAKW